MRANKFRVPKQQTVSMRRNKGCTIYVYILQAEVTIYDNRDLEMHSFVARDPRVLHVLVMDEQHVQDVLHNLPAQATPRNWHTFDHEWNEILEDVYGIFSAPFIDTKPWYTDHILKL